MRRRCRHGRSSPDAISGGDVRAGVRGCGPSIPRGSAVETDGSRSCPLCLPVHRIRATPFRQLPGQADAPRSPDTGIHPGIGRRPTEGTPDHAVLSTFLVTSLRTLNLTSRAAMARSRCHRTRVERACSGSKSGRVTNSGTSQTICDPSADATTRRSIGRLSDSERARTGVFAATSANAAALDGQLGQQLGEDASAGHAAPPAGTGRAEVAAGAGAGADGAAGDCTAARGGTAWRLCAPEGCAAPRRRTGPAGSVSEVAYYTATRSAATARKRSRAPTEPSLTTTRCMPSTTIVERVDSRPGRRARGSRVLQQLGRDPTVDPHVDNNERSEEWSVPVGDDALLFYRSCVSRRP